MKATDSTLTNEEQQAHLASAQASYETALVKVREMRMSRWQHTFLCDPDVGPRGLRMAAQRCAGDQQGGLRRIQIGLALTHLRRGDTEKSAGYMRQAEDGWQRLQETKSALLYSAAIYYAGVATRTQAQGAGALARAYLVASFACASAPRSVAQTAASDPDLTAVLTDSWRKDIPTLIAELELFPPKKRTLVVRWNIITKSLDAATWDTERRYLEPSAVADPARAASSYRRWRRVLTSVGQRRERG